MKNKIEKKEKWEKNTKDFQVFILIASQRPRIRPGEMKAIHDPVKTKLALNWDTRQQPDVRSHVVTSYLPFGLE